MAKTSVIIPARNERFLIPTIEDVFKNARGETEVIAILEGYTPEGWKGIADKYPLLHTIQHNMPKGMRPSINEAAASAIHRGAKYLFKLDAHCMLDEGFDIKLQTDCEPNWVVVPRRKRLDAENWKLQDVGKPDIDYHYLGFPDDPADFGGPGLNGKVWEARARERLNKPEYDIDEEMSSQGSAWFMHAKYFNQLELMDHVNYGTFWNEMQEIGLKAWLSGGQLMVNKKTWYAHLHKGRNHQGADGAKGRGYHLDERQLKQGRNHTMKWLHNEAWPKQSLPFKTVIERFWPVPGWPENWEEQVYGAKGSVVSVDASMAGVHSDDSVQRISPALTIHNAYYGIGDSPDKCIDVTEKLQSMTENGSLDFVVSNDSLGVGNPFRGKKKKLRVRYSYDGGGQEVVIKEEKEWLIIGQGEQYKPVIMELPAEAVAVSFPDDGGKPHPVFTPTGLNKFLITRFSIPPHRLRAPMPIELRKFHRNNLAELFAELGFTHGAEIGVAEGRYSEVLLKANPNLHLLLVDPWHHYSANPQAKSNERHQFALAETKRRTAGYPNVKIDIRMSMDAVQDVPDGSLDFVYIDAMHSFDFVIMDLISWSPKVRTGGIVALDDYYYIDSNRWGKGVVEAVQTYTQVHQINPWFICNAHKSVDAFWVKS